MNITPTRLRLEEQLRSKHGDGPWEPLQEAVAALELAEAGAIGRIGLLAEAREIVEEEYVRSCRIEGLDAGRGWVGDTWCAHGSLVVYRKGHRPDWHGGFGPFDCTYESERGMIGMAELRAGEGRSDPGKTTAWTIRCLKGRLFVEPERFSTEEEAEERAVELLS